METKPQYKVKELICPFSLPDRYVPIETLIQAMLEAQHRALVGIEGVEKGAARVELFWVIYKVEFRQYIERWLQENGDV